MSYYRGGHVRDWQSVDVGQKRETCVWTGFSEFLIKATVYTEVTIEIGKKRRELHIRKCF